MVAEETEKISCSSLPDSSGNYVLVLSERDVERLRVPFTIVAGTVVDVPFALP